MKPREASAAINSPAIPTTPVRLCVGLAILLLMQGASSSFAQGGAAAASYVTGLALVAPLLGRVIDRHGPRSVLLVCALAFPGSLVALIIASAHPELTWLAFGAAAAMIRAFPGESRA